MSSWGSSSLPLKVVSLWWLLASCYSARQVLSKVPVTSMYQRAGVSVVQQHVKSQLCWMRLFQIQLALAQAGQ